MKLLNASFGARLLLSLALPLFIILPGHIRAQRTCGSEENLQRQLLDDPSLKEIRERIEEHIQRSSEGAQERGKTVITIPIVVNVIWHTAVENVSDLQIQSQIDVLNEDFRKLNSDVSGIPSAFTSTVADCEINFCLAKQDPDGCPTTGIRRHETTVVWFDGDTDDMKFSSLDGLDIWDRDRYLNIWVCNMNNNPLGFAQFPGGSAATDGVVIDYRSFGTLGTATSPFNLGRTATHEVGHWLDCFHIWGADPVGFLCAGTDQVADTPNQEDPNFGCPNFPSVSCSNGPNGDMFMNYMDYVDDYCMIMFTNGQKARMQATLGTGGFREPITNSTVCQIACPCNNDLTEISTNTTITTDMIMPGDVIIHSGAELTIQATVAMRQNTRILVERNARLKVNAGGVLTRGCDAPDWAGVQVLGNDQKVQPAHNAALTDPDQAGIVWIDNGTVEWARCGVTAGGGYGAQYWGGVVWTNNAIFQKNRKDAEFMSYPFAANKSRFTNTGFLSGMPSTNTEGITIWETNGIEFDGCRIYSKVLEGIRTYDASIKVHNGCNLEFNETAISSYATYPMANSIIVGTTGVENLFYGNTYDIHASLATGWAGLYSNGKFSLDVVNNKFEGSKYGVIIDGPSHFKIGGNDFVDVNIGAWVASTGYNNLMNQNLIVCNRFHNRMDIGILAIGENKEMQFLANNFEEAYPTSRDFVLTNSYYPISNGAIASLQGNTNVPAYNCFSDPGNQTDIQTWGTTDYFKYYFLATGVPSGCDPEPLTAGNYGKSGVLSTIYIVDCERFGGLPSGLEDPKKEDLEARRMMLQELAPAAGTDTDAGALHQQVMQEKEAILKYLLAQALESGDHATAEDLLMGEQSQGAKMAVFGLRMDRKDYPAAIEWLEQLPVETDADAEFHDIQSINLKRLQNPETFQLSEQQEAYLSAIAESASPMRGYARGILGLLKDFRYYPEAYEFGEERLIPSQPGSTGLSDIRLYPVPASSILLATWPALKSDADATLQVFDLLGNKSLEHRLSPQDTQRTLELEKFQAGVYVLVITDHGKPVYRTKFNVQR